MLSNLDGKKITLRFSILTIFISLFVITILLLARINSFLFEETLTYTSLQLMDQMSLTELNVTLKELEPADVQSRFTADLIKYHVVEPDNIDEMAHYTYHLVKMLPLIQAARWGDASGNFILSTMNKDGTVSSEIYNRRVIPATRTIIERDKNGNIIKKYTSPDVSYDPRTRPWYINAKKQNKSTWTDVYSTLPRLTFSITASTPVYQNGYFKGIFGLDVTLDDLLKFILNQKVSTNGFSFIIKKDGSIIAFPKVNSIKQIDGTFELLNIKSLNLPWLNQSLEIYNKTGNNEIKIKYQGTNYLFIYRPIPILEEHGWLIGIVAPKDDFTKHAEKLHVLALLCALTMLILGIILLTKLVTRIVKPIRYLVKETDKIKNFELEDDIRIQSRILEVVQLANAMKSMKMGLRSFQKYVPKLLVRQLIQAEEDIRIGGTRKQLIVFFSDIANYTTISEMIDPNELSLQTCYYFEKLTQIIINEHGTIDKYIGDSIMAFWGAPFPVDNPEYRAARTALQCQKISTYLNDEWIKEKKYPFITRIGIHSGEAIVGNIGSTERLNYTAVGDTINIANRLEKLNKLYGTHIIVSDDIYQIIKEQFVFRLLDYVAVKGKLKPTYVYELLNDDITFNITEYNECFKQGFNHYQKGTWHDAIHNFNEALRIYPEDKVTPLFIKRCRHYIDNPPEKWDGICRILE